MKLKFSIFFIIFLLSCGSSDGSDSQCVETNCHGSTVACGFGEPIICTEEYVLGDLCRKYVSCEVREGNCVPVEADKHKICEDCIKSCEGRDSLEIFNCDNSCRLSLARIIHEPGHLESVSW